MTLEDQFRNFVSAYYGIIEMDEYDLKVYILKDIENYIRDFIDVNPINNFDYKKEAQEVEKTRPLKTKLQDALLILIKINGPLELSLLIKRKLKELNNKKDI